MLPVLPGIYPVGELTSWGCYVRHASGMTIWDMKLALNEADFRPETVFDDVKSLNMQNISIPTVNQTLAIILNSETEHPLKKTDMPGDLRF